MKESGVTIRSLLKGQLAAWECDDGRVFKGVTPCDGYLVEATTTTLFVGWDEIEQEREKLLKTKER